MSYSQRYKTPSPHFPTPSPTSLERLIQSWEVLRELDVEGYRTSQARPMSTWLTDIQWADARSVRSPGRGTTCSPFVTQSVAMAYSEPGAQPLRPLLATGEPLSFLFSRAANGCLNAGQQRLMDRYGMTMADNEWPRPVIFFNMGFAVEPTQLRRGDAVHIDWMSGGGHAVFCWDVHLDDQGEVDAFQYVSSNGRIRTNGTSEGAGLGVSVGGTPSGSGGFIWQSSADPLRYEALRSPLFVDDERYVAEGAWVTWNPKLKLSDLVGCRTRPRGRLSYARVVKAARFHGITPPPPFAMGAPTAVAQDHACGLGLPERAARDAQAEVRMMQAQLALLHAVGWLATDPGLPDGKAGARTHAALRMFQADQKLEPDGIAGPRTREKLQQIYEAACLSPAGKEFLATGAVTTRPAGGADVSFSVGGEVRVRDLYFRHGTASPGERIEVILEADGLEEQSLALYLRDPQTGTRYATPAVLSCIEGRAAATVRIPELAASAAGPARLVAGIESLGAETALALALAPRQDSVPTVKSAR